MTAASEPDEAAAGAQTWRMPAEWQPHERTWMAWPPGGYTLGATEAEAAFRGQALNEETFARTLEVLLGQAKFRSSARRAGADYRKHIVGGLFKDVLDTAWKRAE